MPLSAWISGSWFRLGLLFLFSFLGGEHGAAQNLRASTPPRGWNSYDSFSWIISEEEFLQNAQIVSDKLLQHGYEYVVVDYLWYRRRVPGAYTNSPGFDVIDEWGRPIPDPGRWPSSKGGKGFKSIARRVHDMGLKFGIHVMRGISTQAVNANTLIMGPRGRPYKEGGRIWRARDIGLKQEPCAWMPACFMSVDPNLGAGRAFLRSLYQQYAEWGVDFVKHDCVFGDDLNVNEIVIVSEILKDIDRPILYSISPGTHVRPNVAMKIGPLVNMYRVTGDDWDTWKDLQAHFNVSRDFAMSGLIGSRGLLGKSWPDLDMLPLGWLTNPGVNEGPHRASKLTLDEQKTQMTLWAMAKSPIIFGGDLRKTDDITMSLITHPTLLDINAYSTNNKEFPYITSTQQYPHSNSKASQSSLHYNTTRGSITLLSLSSCKEGKTNNWFVEMNKLCWKGYQDRSYGSKVCLHWRKHISPTDQFTIDEEYDEGKYYVLASTNEEVCLDSSPNIVSTFGKIKSKHFSSCTKHIRQKWELTHGALLNRYTGLCATVAPLEVAKETNGVRAWVANGKAGEAYISFFNLSPNPSIVSTKVKDVMKMLRETGMDVENKSMIFDSQLKRRCACLEVWSNKELEALNDVISMEVPSHGCTLCTVKCT